MPKLETLNGNETESNVTDFAINRTVTLDVDWSRAFTANGKLVAYSLFMDDFLFYSGQDTNVNFTVDIRNCSFDFVGYFKKPANYLNQSGITLNGKLEIETVGFVESSPIFPVSIACKSI